MIKNLQITVLSENQSSKPMLKAEHGFSLLIEANERQLFFDTGESDLFLKNAVFLSKDLNAVKEVILSHGHYDHTGGLHYLKKQTVYCHPDLFIPKYKSTDQQNFTYIGNEYICCFYEHNNELHFDFCTDSRQLFPGFWLLTNFKKDIQEKYFYKRISDQKYTFDDFSDELALAIQTIKGLVVITGCAHSGIINIIDKALELTKENKIHMLLGGFHLSKKTNSEVQEVAQKINTYTIENIGISHCTGDILINDLNCKNVFNFNTGDKIYA